MAVKSLRNNSDIMIKLADKGSLIIFMDKSVYIQKGDRQLRNTHFYEKIYEDPTGGFLHRVNSHVHNMLEKGHMTEVNCKFLTTDSVRSQLFYMLPKIHKGLNNPWGRLIVQGSSGPTEKTS